MHLDNIRSMHESVSKELGMDIIIVSAENALQEAFWQKHLESLLGNFIKRATKVIAVCEDWPGGAGNGLGTLYAYQKARQKCLRLHGIDLYELQKSGYSIALYHTAGQGKRLSPLTSSENNNKSSVKLPGFINEPSNYMTLLDAVIKQTAIFAPLRKGRLSVFWSDQIFIPSLSLCPPNSHVEILGILDCFPSQEQWKKEGWENFGLIGNTPQAVPQLMEKESFDTVQHLVKENKLLSSSMGRSLGSFSLSAPLTHALLELFHEELEDKKEKMDSDPFFWMPATLDHSTYLSSMVKKNHSKEKASSHYLRMEKFKQAFTQKHSTLDFFGVANLGKNCLWWDFGTVDSYFKNLLKLTENNKEGEAFRNFLDLKLDLSTCSVIHKSKVLTGSVKNSVVVGSHSEELSINNCVILNSDLGKANGINCLLYNVSEKSSLELKEKTIRADVFLKDRHLELTTQLGRDGKEDWNQKLPENSHSYEEVYHLNNDKTSLKL